MTAAEFEKKQFEKIVTNADREAALQQRINVTDNTGNGAAGKREMRPWVTATEIEAATYKVPQFAVPGLIPVGLTILAGRPKIGKSWLALSIADCISRGVPAIGNIELTAGPVLYLALEDTQRRLQGRLRAVRQGAQPSVRLALATSWPRLDDGGLDQLEAEMDAKWRLIIIDTFAKVRPDAKRDSGVYQADYDAVSGLKALADRHGTAIVLVHHLRKGGSNDPLEEVSGSTGLTGAVDSVLVLKRDRTQADGVLFATGRDIEERELALQFDKSTGLWTVLGDAAEYRDSQERRDIRKVLSEVGQPMTPKQVAAELDKPYEAVKKTMQRMAADGTVGKKGLGKYVYA